MGWVERRGKRWRGRVRVGTETLSTEPTSTKAQAAALLRQLEVELDTGTWIDPRGGDGSFRGWAEAWQRTRGVLEKSTQRADEGRLRMHLMPAFGDMALTDITPLVVRQFVSTLTEQRAARTVRHCHALLHTILEAAVEEGLLRKNPCTGTRLPRAARSEQVCLTEQEIGRLLAAFGDGMPRALATTLAGTGMRWGEAVGLRVRRVDLLKRELHVRQTLTEVDGQLRWKDYPKTKRSYRSISLPAAVVDELVPLVVGRHGDDLVFRTDDCTGGCLWCRRAVEDGRDVRLVHGVRNRNFRARHWDKARDAAGITSRPTPHDLRHSHVAILLAGGAPLTAVQHRLGHESIQITSDIYGYLLPRVDEHVIGVLDGLFGPGANALPPDVGAGPAPTPM